MRIGRSIPAVRTDPIHFSMVIGSKHICVVMYEAWGCFALSAVRRAESQNFGWPSGYPPIQIFFR